MREEAERSLVGGVLGLELTHGEIEDLVTTCPKGAVKGMHYSDAWNAIVEAHKKGKAVDLVSVFDELIAAKSSVDAAMLAQMMIQTSTLQAVFHWAEKLAEIIRSNDIRSVTIVRMEVPCCGGLELAAKKALQASGKFIPWQGVTISLDGTILDR